MCVVGVLAQWYCCGGLRAGKRESLCAHASNARVVRALQVGVHIADVTHFVKPGSAVDVEAANRCTSVYLVDRRVDMLPKALTEDICSLRADVERLTFSVIWEMDPDANIVNSKFHKSVIKSSSAMSYQEAQVKCPFVVAPKPSTKCVGLGLRHLRYGVCQERIVTSVL